MNCKKCFQKYDKIKHIPTILMPCGHSFCRTCIDELKKQIYSCPVCYQCIISEKPNFELIEIIEQTAQLVDPNADFKISIYKLDNQIKEFKDELEMKYFKKCKDNKDMVNSLKKEINLKTNHVIDFIFEQQKKLLHDVEHIENIINKSMAELVFNQKEIFNPEQLEFLSRNQLNLLNANLKSTEEELKSKLALLEKLNFNCEFKENKSVNKLNLLGTISYNKSGLILSGSFDNSIKVWDISSGECVKTLLGHSNWIFCIEILTSSLIASGSSDKNVHIWDIVSGKCVRILQGHLGSVYSIQVLSFNRLASCSADKTIKIWNFNTGDCLHTLKEHKGEIWILKNLAHERFLSGSEDSFIKIWNTNNGVCTTTLAGHSSSISCLEIMEKQLISGSYDSSIKLWDYQKGKDQKLLKNSKIFKETFWRVQYF